MSPHQTRIPLPVFRRRSRSRRGWKPAARLESLEGRSFPNAIGLPMVLAGVPGIIQAAGTAAERRRFASRLVADDARQDLEGSPMTGSLGAALSLGVAFQLAGAGLSSGDRPGLNVETTGLGAAGSVEPGTLGWANALGPLSGFESGASLAGVPASPASRAGAAAPSWSARQPAAGAGVDGASQSVFAAAGVSRQGLASGGTEEVSTSGGRGSSVLAPILPPGKQGKKVQPVFSQLTPSQAITQGTPAVNLSGVLTSSVGAPAGQVVTIMVGPSTASAVVQSSGAFSTTISTAALAPSDTPYTITYSYAGDSNFQPATDRSTTLTVTALNHAPVAGDDAATTTIDTTMTMPAPGVLANDTDQDSDALQAVLVAGPAHGTLALRPDGSFDYTPQSGFSGTDSFTYAASDGALLSAAATVSLNVMAASDPPYGGAPSIPGLISITTHATITRTSGMTPLVVQVNAAGTTATFSDGGAAFRAQVGRDFDPYLDLEYTWDFGDAAGTETFTHPVTGAIVNANRDQTGPEAAYVYRSPGTYTITLSARGWDGSHFVTASTTTLLIDEIQQIRLTGAPTGGTYRLSFNGQTTAPIAYNATPAQARAALEALPAIGAGNVRETGSGLYFEFVGAKAGQGQALLTADGSGLTGGTSPSVEVRRIQAGAAAPAATATAWTGTDRYFDSNYNGSNGPSDGTINRPFTTFAALKSWIEGGDNRRALVARGASFDASAGIRTSDRRSIRVEAYGSGPAPVLRSASGSGVVVGEAQYGTDSVDVIFSGIELRQDATGGSPLFFYASSNGDRSRWYNALRDYAFLDCTFVGRARVLLASPTSETGSRWTFWRSEFIRDASTVQDGQALLIGLGSGLAVVGGRFSGGNGDIMRDHYIYPTIYDHSLYRWIDFQAATSLNFCINTNARSDGIDVPHVLIDGSDITGTQNGIDASNSHNDPSQGRFDQFIIQNSAIHIGQAGSQGVGVYTTGLSRAVIRGNLFWANRLPDVSLGDSATHLSFYQNKLWRSDGSPMSFQSQASGYVAGNELMTTADASGEAALVAGPISAMGGWRFDGNTYYAPNMLVSGQPMPFRDTVLRVRRSFPQWQSLGFDPRGRYADPGWRDPSRGDFSRVGG